MLNLQTEQESYDTPHLNKPNQDDSVEQLVRRVIAGNNDAFDQLINDVYADIYRFSFHLTKDKAQAEDLTHDVVLKVAKSIKQFKFDCAFLSWVYRIVVNTQKDHYKKQANRLKRDNQYYVDHQFQQYSPGPDDEAQFNDLLAAIDQLPRKLKLTLILVYAEQLSHAQTADVMQCSSNTISWRIHEAKKQLKKILENQS